MPSRGWRAALPYLGALCASALLYALAEHIAHTPRPGTLGPDFWPKMAALLIGAAAAFELLRQLITGRAETGIQGAAGEAQEKTSGAAGTEPAKSHPLTLAAGIALTALYAVALPVLGFMLASFLLLVAFMYLGGIRNHLAVWGTSALGVLLFAFVFLKIAYISLPRGQPPFDQVTQLIMTILQVK